MIWVAVYVYMYTPTVTEVIMYIYIKNIVLLVTFGPFLSAVAERGLSQSVKSLSLHM